MNTYSVGQEVMMKRNFGENRKIAVNWKRGPYTIDKKMGPSTYAIKGPKGGTKVYHHNNLKPVLERHEASKTANNCNTLTAEPKEDLHESTPIIPQVDTEQSIDENLPSHTADPSALSPPLTRPLKLPFNNLQVDMSAFRENVINIPQEDMAAFGGSVPYHTSPTSQQPTSDVEIVLDQTLMNENKLNFMKPLINDINIFKIFYKMLTF